MILLVPRRAVLKVNTKNAMIKDFMAKLDELIQYKKKTHDAVVPPPPREPHQSASRDHLCLNANCKFIEFLRIFHPNLNFWRLPASPSCPNHFCEVCLRFGLGTLARSHIRIRHNKDVCFVE